VLELQESTLGPVHPNLSPTLLGLSSMERAAGDLDAARAHAERALEVGMAALGPDHPQIAAALARIAEVQVDAGDLDAARGFARRALAIFDRARLENTGTVEQLQQVGDIERRLGNERSARASFERAVALATKLYGPEHAMTVDLRERLSAAPPAER
jgi:tetratricopeptide (TPR) repeat protein